MCKLLTAPAMSLEVFSSLYTPDEGVIFYKQSGHLNYSFPTLKEMMQAQKEIDWLIYDNGLRLRYEITSGVLNHIITIKNERS